MPIAATSAIQLGIVKLNFASPDEQQVETE